MKSDLPYLDKISIWSSHLMISKRINALPPRSKILDVGMASGTLARICQNGSLRFFGVESNENWAKMAFNLYEKIWIGSIQEMEDEILAGYDAVVLGDILEHLSDPEIVLQRLVDAQSSGSLFIISVPNVANLWIRLNLLVGRFDYTDRGILDRTHLRFFTRKSLVGMIEKSGLEIRSIGSTPIPLELVSSFFVTSPGKLLHAILAHFTFLLPTILGYQFVIEARKP